MAAYAEAVDRLGWLMDALEVQLESLPDGADVESNLAQEADRERRATKDEAMAALEALTELGVLASTPGGLVLKHSVLNQTSLYRAGVRAGLAIRRTDTSRVALCATVPPGLATRVETALRQYTEDLRGAIVDLVAGAREDIVMASPFWDRPTLDEIRPLLLRRLEAGVSVRLLGRFGAQIPTDVRDALIRLTNYSGFQLVSWYEQGNWNGTRTFHFKAAIVDGGRRAYLGTANFTASGLRSRLEIGVLLEGEMSRRLADIINVVLALARPVSLGDNT
jgi:phosphatidylserine/phosphatidylglycerophosphate/cardiolipin synthase-like enzyme